MRRDPTPAEARVWFALRNGKLDGLKFRRQVVMGRYIADFYCPSAGLVVEIDGATHVEAAGDATRDAWMRAEGLRVLRIWNNDVMGNLAGVLTAIRDAARHTPPPAPSHKGRGKEVSRC